MPKFRFISKVLLCGIAVIAQRSQIARCDDVLQDKDVVAICGDSITEQKIYSMYMETYLLACKPKMDLQIDQFGWGGETAGGFLARIKTDVVPFRPTIATTCYGMNDGRYMAMIPATGDVYKKAMEGVLATLKEGGVRTVVVGGPGCVDSEYFKRNGIDPDTYNQTLGALSDIARDLAKTNNLPFADVHGAMMTVMAAAKQKYGNKFIFAGGDGVHPTQAGHIVMAYAFLKAMGCDGDIGTITVDLKASASTATDGHKIISSANGTTEIQSTRYPFCFLGDGKSSGSERSVADLFPFNADLNRFTLIVKNAGAGDVKITWGDVSKTFPADVLAKGINLAAEFEEANPFTKPIGDLEKAIAAQQAFETTLVKGILHGSVDIIKNVPDAESSEKSVEDLSMKHDQDLIAAAAKVAATPVQHTIKIEPAP